MKNERGKTMYRYEMHIHTAEGDIYAQISGAEIVRRYHDAGYSGLVVTDHYFSLFHEWFAHEIANAPHEKIIERWLRGYDAARNEGQKLGFTVLPGAEVRFDGQINDYLVYGVDEEFFYHAPLLHQLQSLQELIDILPDGAVVVQAHPFRDNMTVCDPAPLFGIEGYNAGTDPFRNEMAKIFAAHYHKKITSGSDLHNQDALAKGGIQTLRKIVCPKDLVAVLKDGAYSIIENGEATK